MQKRLCRKLLESSLTTTFCQTCNRNVNTKSIPALPLSSSTASSAASSGVAATATATALPVSVPHVAGIQNNKENLSLKKKRSGIFTSRRVSKSDRRVEEMTQQISYLENCLQKSKLVRGQDVEKIAKLGTENIEQRTHLLSLEQQIKQSNSIIANLEQQVENSNCEIMDLKEMHNLEKEEIQIEYEELKEETSNLVSWLKEQLSTYKGKSIYAKEIAIAKEEEDLESLTNSEREALSREIEAERKKWLVLAEGHSADSNSSPHGLLHHTGGESIGASTLTSRSSM